MRFRKFALATALGAAVASGPLAIAPASAETVLKAVMHSDVKIIDPIWTTAYISRNVGYMIYDTLFALDAKNDVKPQMVDKVDVSADKLTYTMTLRDGLLWHDGQPVTAEDCIQSLKRWSAKDSLGQKVFTGFVSEISSPDARTIVIKLKEPTGLLLFALGKPSSNVPFMMPKRVAETDPGKQISEFIGSGPFVLKRTNGSPATRSSSPSSTSTSRAPNRLPLSPAARSSRSIASNGWPSPTPSRRSTRCRRARSTTWSSRRTTCCRSSRATAI